VSAIARARNGHIIAVRVVVVPEQLPPRLEGYYVERERGILDAARQRARTHDVPMTSLVRIGHNPARAILETSRERECDLLVVGWKGHTSTARYILGEITDTIVMNARTDIMVVKLVGKALPKRLLLPTHGGVHAQQAENYAADIAASQDGTVTLCAIVPPDAQEELIQSENERLREARDRIVAATIFDRVETIIVQNRSVTDGIVEELKNHDGVIVGAAGKSFSNRILFGNIPEEVARLSDKPVIVVKRHHTVKALFGRVMSE